MLWNKNEDLILDEYDDTGDDVFYNVDTGISSKINSIEEEEYENFFKNDEYEDSYEDDYTEYENDIDDDVEDSKYETIEKDNSNIMKYLNIFSIWFRRIGIVIAVILIALFITQGKVKTLLLYILGLIVSFLFGYGFMYVLSIFNEDE